MTEVVLLGGGHANVQVLKSLALARTKSLAKCKYSLTMVSNFPTAFYSGMLPGCIAGFYREDEIQMKLDELCGWAGATFVQATATGVDTKNRLILCGDHEPIPYDILSINVGSTVRGLEIPGVKEYSVPTRPLSSFMEHIKIFERNRDPTQSTMRIIVVGGGAAGIELCWALQTRFRRRYSTVEVTLITHNTSLLSEMGSWVSNTVTKTLAEKQVKIVLGSFVTKVTQDTLWTDSGKTYNFDLLVWATGAAAPSLLSEIDAEKDKDGYLLVSDTLQASAPCVLAAGDCVTIKGFPYVRKAGVYAVREGPILTKNIMMIIQHGTVLESAMKSLMMHYVPQTSFLALLMTGDGEAISSWKGIALKGSMVWKLKDKIDRDFMNLFDVKLLGPRP